MGQDTFDRLQLLDAKITLEEQAASIGERITDVFLSVPDNAMYDEMLTRVILPIMESTVGVFGYIDAGGSLVCASMTGAAWERCKVKDKDFVFPQEVWSGIWRDSLVDKKIYWLNDGLTLPEGHFPLSRALNGPVLFRGRSIGLIQVGNKDTDYTQADANTLERISRVIAPVLYMRLQQDRVEKELVDIKQQIAGMNHGK